MSSAGTLIRRAAEGGTFGGALATHLHKQRPHCDASCIVTERFLRFEEKTQPADEGRAVIVHVMTEVSGTERKLATLIVTLEQLRKVLKQYE
jgi:hypothetical protein